MKPEGVATLSLSYSIRDSMRITKQRLDKANLELSSGRYADVGLQLGSSVGRNLNWRVESSRMKAAVTNNERALGQADLTQTTLQTLVKTASDFLSTLTGTRNSQNGQIQAQQAAQQAMATISNILNTTYDGKYIFGGQNIQTKPINDYAGSSAETNFDNAFATEFGVANTDPSVVNIQAADMKNFLDNGFDQLFDDTNWKADWSTANDINVQANIDNGRMADLGANANEAGMRDLFKAVTAVMEAGTGKLSQASFETVIDFALAKIGNATLKLGQIQSRVGFGQAEATRSNDNLNRQVKILEDQVTETETVDPTEVSVRVNVLMSQLEASYSVTGRISKMSLLNYI